MTHFSKVEEAFKLLCNAYAVYIESEDWHHLELLNDNVKLKQEQLDELIVQEVDTILEERARKIQKRKDLEYSFIPELNACQKQLAKLKAGIE